AGAPIDAPVPIPVNPPSETPPNPTERASTTPQIAEPHEGSLLGGGSDAFIPIPPGSSVGGTASTSATAQPEPGRSSIRSATDKFLGAITGANPTPTPVRPIPVAPTPQRVVPKSNLQPTPIPVAPGKSTQRGPGPTPWPTPKFTAQAQSP